jgi:cell division inhibitor SulA
MSTKKLQIINENTGEIMEEAKFTGGYHVIYTNIDDMGRLKHIRELDNAKFGDRHWIKNFVYRPIAKKLIEKFDELTPINPLRILFLEDMEYEKPAGGKNQ